MIGLGIFLSIIFGLLGLFVSLSYFVTCWRCSLTYTMFAYVIPMVISFVFVGIVLLAAMSGGGDGVRFLAMGFSLLLVPVWLVAIVFMIMLLVKFWQELGGLFFASLIVGFLMLLPTFMIAAGMDEKAKELAAEQQAEQDPRSRGEIALDNQMRRMEEQQRERDKRNQHLYDISQRLRDSKKKTNTTPPPPPKPDNPIFKPGTLAQGLMHASDDEAGWPAFTPPTEIDPSEGKALNLQGYEVLVPTAYEIAEVRPIGDGQGMQWKILGGLLDNGRSIELTVRVKTLPQQPDGRVFTPSWSEAKGRARVSPESDSIQYGLIGEIPFVRCANELVRTGHGVGKVVYIGLPSPENPHQIELEFATHPEGFGPLHALTCEAIVRSLARSQRRVMDLPNDATALPGGLVSTQGSALSPEDWHVHGPFAFALGEHASVSFSRLTRDGASWTTALRANRSRDSGIEITLTQDDAVHVDRLRPIALQGPLRTDAAVCAYGGDARYVRLWNDEAFARIEHLPIHYDNATHQRVTYHGYVNQYRVDIVVTNRSDSTITMAQLLDSLLRSRLANAVELAEHDEQADWIKEVLEHDDAFIIANGVDAKAGLLLDDRGQITLSPQYDTELHQMFQVFPPLDGPELLTGYEQWTSEAPDEGLLGRAESIDDLSIQPIAELRAEHSSNELSWQARTRQGNVGMTVHVEKLKPAEFEILTPIVQGSGRTRIRLGRRQIQPSQTPDITYRELRNLRVWRVQVPANARQAIARCHYLAIVPGKMIVISASYLADRPEQLEAFDKSVATLLYQDGKLLTLDTPAE